MVVLIKSRYSGKELRMLGPANLKNDIQIGIDLRNARSEILQKKMEINTNELKKDIEESILDKLEYENSQYFKELQQIERERDALQACIDILV